jgi:hypothetical protein
MKMKYSLACFMAAIASVFHMGAREEVSNVASATGTHEKGIVSLVAEEAISTRYLLVKKGSAANGILINAAATTVPWGVCQDEPANTDTAAVAVLGAAVGTVKMVAGAACTAGAAVYTAADGKISGTPASGSYKVGVALNTVSADGSIVEVAHQVPQGPYQPTGVTTHTGSTGSVAVPITHRTVNLTTTGAHTATLADGVFVGQRLDIICVAYSGGAATLTPTTGAQWSTFVFAVKGQRVSLEWTSAGWLITGFIYLTTLPVITVP